MTQVGIARLQKEYATLSKEFKQQIDKDGIITDQFVAAPDEEPDGGWPEEQKLRKALDTKQQGRARGLSDGSKALPASGAHFRTPMPLSELHEKLREPNEQLKARGEPEVIEEEAIGARLYTGDSTSWRDRTVLVLALGPAPPTSPGQLISTVLAARHPLPPSQDGDLSWISKKTGT